MFKTVDEFELRRTPEAPGVYAFHLRAIRPSTVGLDGVEQESTGKLKAARSNCISILKRILRLQQQQYDGYLRQVNTYSSHGTALAIEGHIAYTTYLQDQIGEIDPSDVVAFVRAAESLATILPPVYVGMTDKQSIHARYKQHRNDHANRREGTFGGRLALAGFQWSDVAFSFVPGSNLRMQGHSLATLETYIQFFSRPVLGRA